jgi:hypothetical protein
VQRERPRSGAPLIRDLREGGANIAGTLARHRVTARMLHRCRHGRTLMFADFACSSFAEIWEILFGLSCTGL